MTGKGTAAPALVERFRSDLANLCDMGKGPLLVAVSGGPDSMAMLALAYSALPGRVLAATVDHGLRPENKTEAAMVANWCAAHGIGHTTLTVEVPPGSGDNLQGWARQHRYLLLKRCAIAQDAAALATAHHADDQAETFLMRAARGSGLAGLASIRARLDEEVPIASSAMARGGEGWGSTVQYGALATVRPLLGWRRADLRALCLERNLPFVDDPSNADARFDRSRFRDWLEVAPWLDPTAMGRSAAHLAEADRDLNEVSRWLYAARQLESSPYEQIVDVADLPRGVRRLIARIAIDDVRSHNGIQAPDWSWAIAIEPLLDALEVQRAVTQAGILAEATGTTWRFSVAPPRRSG